MFASLKNRRGFTLIELLIVIVIVSILAAIAIPKFEDSKEREQVRTSLQAALAQAKLWKQLDSTYVGSLPIDSSGAVVTVIGADSTGWVAKAVFPKNRYECQVGIGTMKLPDIREEQMVCRVR